jgi:hypothetical protein
MNMKVSVIDMSQCFRTADELKVGYSITPTFG